MSADGPITYTLVLDGRKILTTQGLQATIEPQRLGDGVHHLQLLATDSDGQSTLSVPSTLSIERTPPIVKISHAQGGYIVVRVLDSYSGIDTHAVSVSFGEPEKLSVSPEPPTAMLFGSETQAPEAARTVGEQTRLFVVRVPVPSELPLVT